MCFFFLVADWLVVAAQSCMEWIPVKLLLVQEMHFILKAFVHYFLSNLYFLPNDSPSKTMKNVFYFIWKALFVLNIFNFLYFFPLFFFPVSHCFRGWSKKNLKVYDVINCLNMNFITICLYLKKEIRCDIETLSIDRELNKEHFYGKIMQKMCTKS